MQQPPNIFDWTQELVTDRSERLSRPAVRAVVEPAIPFAKSAVPAAVWEQMRDAPKERDRVLSRLAVAWCAELPEEMRPVHLCAAYPRIANRLALSWKDQTLAKLILDSLLGDKRGGRQGFPRDVAHELGRLRRHAAAAPAQRVAVV